MLKTRVRLSFTFLREARRARERWEDGVRRRVPLTALFDELCDVAASADWSDDSGQSWQMVEVRPIRALRIDGYAQVSSWGDLEFAGEFTGFVSECAVCHRPGDPMNEADLHYYHPEEGSYRLGLICCDCCSTLAIPDEDGLPVVKCLQGWPPDDEVEADMLEAEQLRKAEGDGQGI